MQYVIESRLSYWITALNLAQEEAVRFLYDTTIEPALVTFPKRAEDAPLTEDDIVKQVWA